MAIDVKSYKKKINNKKVNFNLVPFIDILFTIMIFLVVTSSFASTSDITSTTTDAGTGKPNVTDVSGNAEYYIMPVDNLHKVTVNGVDMSSYIRGSAIGVHAQVIDQGQIVIKPGEIIITTPAGFDVNKAVAAPK